MFNWLASFYFELDLQMSDKLLVVTLALPSFVSRTEP